MMSFVRSLSTSTNCSPRVGGSPPSRPSPSEHDPTIRVVIVPHAAPHLRHPVVLVVCLATSARELAILCRKRSYTQRPNNWNAMSTFWTALSDIRRGSITSIVWWRRL